MVKCDTVVTNAGRSADVRIISIAGAKVSFYNSLEAFTLYTTDVCGCWFQLFIFCNDHISHPIHQKTDVLPHGIHNYILVIFTLVVVMSFWFDKI